MKGKIYEDISLIQNRSRIAYVVVGVMFVIVIIFFWKIQILDHEEYWEKSESNRIRELSLPAQRGMILARNGEILARNVASFKVSLIRENSADFEDSVAEISRVLGLEIDIVKERVSKYEAFPAFYPIVIKDDLGDKEVALIESRRLEFPELLIEAEPKREYLLGNFASHVIGYMQEVTPDELRSGKASTNRIGDLVGRSGIEKEYEERLVGVRGRVLEVVDSLGRKKEEMSRREPVKGDDIKLTLDFKLQNKAEELLQGKEGAVVVMHPKTGEILALASFPDFDPNKFITRFTPREWIELTNRVDYPLENRAIRGLYSPGSVFKLVLALAGLDSKMINEYTAVKCGGSILIYGHPFSCWYEPGHGSMNLYSGIKNSCNIYFYLLGKRLGIQKISHYARMLGLGSLTGIDLFGEKQGLVPDPDWKKRTSKLPWYPGETISVAIGQGPLLVTPLQIASLVALIANRGKGVFPHLTPDGRKGMKPSVPLSLSLFEKVIRGMWMSANDEGTARAARIAGYDVCGKTGSTQVVSRKTAEKMGETVRETKTHSWFAGFAPRDDPEIVVAIIVEYGGTGGAIAAPIARELFHLYREEYD